MEIETIAIIGAGELGRRIAYLALRAGYATILEDTSVAALEQGVAAIRGLVTADAASAGKGVAPTGTFFAKFRTAHAVEEAVRDADLIIETVSDEMEMKLELFTIFDKFAKPGAIFASTTGSFSIADLAEMTFCPDRCIGMRFVPSGSESTHEGSARGHGRLELAKGPLTSEDTVTSCGNVGLRMKLAVRILDGAIGSE